MIPPDLFSMLWHRPETKAKQIGGQNVCAKYQRKA